ncbi:MAG: trypsin-like peptidase domain-containing protein [Spirochaetia bacterium]|jgi:S1-C subfamily serine protease
MKCRPVIAVFLLAFLAACATDVKAPRPVPLPEERLKDVRDLVSSGSYLQSIAVIDAMRREKVAVDAEALDSLQAQAVDALGSAFHKALSEKSYGDALRLLDSATSLGKPDLGTEGNKKSLLEQIAAAQDAAGDQVIALLTRLRILSLPGPMEADYSAALSEAMTLGNHSVTRLLSAAMKEKGFAVPAAALTEADAVPSFPRMISGTVTIMVNRGIKVENGVGYPDRVIGSGFFVDKRGYILTNHHVIESEVDPKYEGYSRLYIRLSDSPAGERIPAKVIGYDKTFDLALIKTEVTPAYVFGGSSDQSVAPGDHIYAIGSPAGLEKTVTSGIISAMGRRLLEVGDSMQVDVPLNPGNSGGPLLNEKGDVIGIVFAGLPQFPGLNFAVPFALVEKALPALYKGGKAVHPWLGMAVAETDKGIEVIYVVPDEPAEVAGIKSGDIIESIDGVPFTKLKDIQESVLPHTPPALLRLAFRRGEARMQAIVCLDERPDDPIQVALKRDTRDNVVYPLFGMQLENVGSFLWKGDYIVKRVTKGSIADESGISVDDPLTIQAWQLDTEKKYAVLQVVIRKRKAGFFESAIQIASYLQIDNFI